jgi:transposase InsO family protein
VIGKKRTGRKPGNHGGPGSMEIMALRKRLLNVHWFTDLDEVRKLAEEWRKRYNTIQRHGSLN